MFNSRKGDVSWGFILGGLTLILVLVLVVFFNTKLLANPANELSSCTPPSKYIKGSCDLKYSITDPIANSNKKDGFEDYSCCKPLAGKTKEFNEWVATQETPESVKDGVKSVGDIRLTDDVSFQINGEAYLPGSIATVYVGDKTKIQAVKVMERGNSCDLAVYKAEKIGGSILKKDISPDYSNLKINCTGKDYTLLLGSNLDLKIHDSNNKNQEDYGLYLVELIVYSDDAAEKEYGFWKTYIRVSEKPE